MSLQVKTGILRENLENTFSMLSTELFRKPKKCSQTMSKLKTQAERKWTQIYALQNSETEVRAIADTSSFGPCSPLSFRYWVDVFRALHFNMLVLQLSHLLFCNALFPITPCRSYVSLLGLKARNPGRMFFLWSHWAVKRFSTFFWFEGIQFVALALVQGAFCKWL